MSALSEPLTPAECDLRDFAFLPLDIVRLFNSRFHAISTDGEWRAGVTLWLKSFHQIPAGSLPTDDIELCRLAELGRDQKAWSSVKTVALHGWIECADGRLYHPTVCEKAREAWARKTRQRERSRLGNARRWGRDPDADVSTRVASDRTNPEVGDKADRTTEGAQEELPRGTPRGIPKGIPKGVPEGVPEGIPKGVPEGVPEGIPKGVPEGVPEGVLQRSQGTGTGIETEIGRKNSPHDPSGRSPPMTSALAKGARLDPEWVPRDDDYHFAAGLGLDPNAVLDGFRDYWVAQPGAKGRKADWFATWRNWCRREAERQRSPPHKPQRKLDYLSKYNGPLPGDSWPAETCR